MTCYQDIKRAIKFKFHRDTNEQRIRCKLPTKSDFIKYLCPDILKENPGRNHLSKHWKVNLLPYPVLVAKEKFLMFSYKLIMSLHRGSGESHDLPDIYSPHHKAIIKHFFQEFKVKFKSSFCLPFH